jgi:putative transposase
MTDIDGEAMEVLRKHERTGRPIGDDDFIENAGKTTGRRVKARQPGPKAEIVNLL